MDLYQKRKGLKDKGVFSIGTRKLYDVRMTAYFNILVLFRIINITRRDIYLILIL